MPTNAPPPPTNPPPPPASVSRLCWVITFVRLFAGLSGSSAAKSSVDMKSSKTLILAAGIF